MTMRFFGAFMLLVLPLFLLVCVQMIKKSDFYETVMAKVLIAIFYVFAAAGIATALWLVTLI